MTKTTLVIGASTNPERYSNKAIKKLLANNYPVLAIGNKAGAVAEVTIAIGLPTLAQVHTITLYLNPNNQKPYYDYILGLHPQRIIFNPGTENEELEQMAKKAGIQTMEACTLVMLATGQY